MCLRQPVPPSLRGIRTSPLQINQNRTLEMFSNLVFIRYGFEGERRVQSYVALVSVAVDP